VCVALERGGCCVAYMTDRLAPALAGVALVVAISGKLTAAA